MRKIRNPLGTEEAPALREAERQAQAQDDPGPQEDAPEALGRQAGDSLGEDFQEAEEDADSRALEFDVLLRLVSHLARTPPGRRALARSTPAFDEDSVRALLEETSEAWQLRARHGRLPLAGVEDIRGALGSLADAGGSARAEDFRPILTAARAARAVGRALAKAESPRLSARRERLSDFTVLSSRAQALFDADGSIKDDASPELAAVRAKLRRRRAEVSRGLAKILDARRDFLGDAVVVMRNDRYCLPVLVSARGRVPGIVHDRSGSGQTVFIEPMEVIESNNDLALLAAEERREIERLLSDFGREVLASSEELERAVDEMAALDALEAKVEFGELSEGRLPEISDDGGWTLTAARHPLLDERLAPLRRRVLNESRDEKKVVPVDLDLSPGKTMLVVSGPNAGGKTVVLKTAGLFSLLAQSGFPVPAGPGTRLPVFRSIRTEIGDAQQILADRSTFSSSMETLAQILADSGPGTLALIDEIGGSTDPEEGSALAVAYLEELLARGGRAIVTTHFSGVKGFAAGRSEALLAAMEFDEATGRPTYRLHAGLSGRSRALSVAREQGIPTGVLDRAGTLLGDAWRRRQERETDAEAALERLRRAEAELERERENAREESRKAAAERDRLKAERARMLEEGLAGFARARRELARRVEEDLARIRASARSAEPSADGILARAEETSGAEPLLAEARREALERTSALAAGGRARLKGSKTEATVLSIDETSAWLEFAGKRMRVERADLEPLQTEPARPRQRAREAAKEAAPLSAAATREINVIGERLDDAVSTIEKQLDEALLAGAGRLRIVHGHGTGRLRDGIRERLREHPSVASFRAADAREGGNGATIVELI